MPKFYRKRRRAKTENKNEAGILRERAEENSLRAEGVMKQRYPVVDKLVIALEFRNAQKHILAEETREFGPEDICDLRVDCPGVCGTGTFDLASKIDQVVNQRLPSTESHGVCQDPMFGGSQPGACNTELRCRIKVSYAAGA